MKHNFEERRANRLEWAEDQAAKNYKESTQLFERSSEMASVIPFGQPILIGHHSEKKDRRYRSKIHNTMGKSVAAQRKADYYENKAKSIENNKAIFSDDPEALVKLRGKYETLEKVQSFMKDANKCIKKKDKEAFLKLEYGTEAKWNELITPDFMGRTGYPTYSLTNNSSNMRNIKKRMEQMQKQESKPAIALRIVPADTENLRYIQILENREANRVQLFFSEIPDEATRKAMKGRGFKWCRSEKAWQRHLNQSAIWNAQSLAMTFLGEDATVTNIAENAAADVLEVKPNKQDAA